MSNMQARALLLNKFAALIEEHARELAMLEALVSQPTQPLLSHCCRPRLSATTVCVMLLGGTAVRSDKRAF